MGLGFEKTETYLAVAADVIGVNTLDSRFLQNTCCFAISTCIAFEGVYLPGIGVTASTVPSKTRDSAYGQK
jgi:hypothetical protein